MNDDWETYAGQVKPLEKKRKTVRPPRKYVQLAAGRKAEAERHVDPLPPVVVAREAPPPKNMPASRLADIDRRSYDRFRKGKNAIDFTLDLHGMTQAEAWPQLRRTVETAQMQGMRCLLVITGRGRLGGGEWGVLRRAVPEWLQHPDISHRILAYHPAQREHGGEGAYYVLLRRLRD